MGLFLALFGCVVLVLFLVSNCLIPFSSHKSCGVFQVSVEGHWTYSGTYVLVLRVSLCLFNLDCRYPRDLLQPARKKKSRLRVTTSLAVTSRAATCIATLFPQRRLLIHLTKKMTHILRARVRATVARAYASSSCVCLSSSGRRRNFCPRPPVRKPTFVCATTTIKAVMPAHDVTLREITCRLIA